MVWMKREGGEELELDQVKNRMGGGALRFLGRKFWTT